MLRSLQAVGKLKRAKDPEQALIAELFHNSIEEIRCRQCNQYTYEATEADSFENDSLAVKGCDRCNTPIDPDRLEIFPHTTHCMKCQQLLEANPAADEEPDYCPRCGGLMKLSKRSRGVVKYVLSCGDCGYK
jgi:RNA polymerase-binding transcription factor DksA